MNMFDDPHVAGDLIKHNREMHDLLAPLYETRHLEIFNPVEQRRIRELLQALLERFLSRGITPHVLDFGAGTGNLTKQLLNLGASVVAADVSEGSLKELLEMTGRPTRLETMKLNGQDLSEIEADRFDMVATYSVLHHVPDYLAIIDEFVRVVKPGGIIYLDHEVCPSYWDNSSAYLAYSRELEEWRINQSDSFWKRLLQLFTRKGSWRYLWATLKLRVIQAADDGDIHVHPEDHIEWGAIRERLEHFCQIISEDDYLVCRERQNPPEVWSRWRERCVDMRYLIARKN